MRSEFLPFSRPSIDDEAIGAVNDVLRSGWITTGARAAEFEKRFCEYTGCAGAVALSSATGGMHLLLCALGIGAGDEVITPSMTWVSTANMIVLAVLSLCLRISTGIRSWYRARVLRNVLLPGLV